MSVIHGDCLEVMAGMEPESVDAIVTDPPYNLTDVARSFQFTQNVDGSPRVNANHRNGFMGKAWDGTGIAFRPETWAAALRVAKPSAYLLAFGGTRTVHRMTVALEDAGWIIRDMLVWAYASGFPKSKASLKPAWEPIVMARKPGPLRMLAIDECRIGTDTMPELPGELGAHGVYGRMVRRSASGPTTTMDEWDDDASRCDSCAEDAGSPERPGTSGTEASTTPRRAERQPSERGTSGDTSRAATGCSHGMTLVDDDSSSSIDESGRTPTGLFLSGSLSTISTRTSSITGSRTCTCCGGPITPITTSATRSDTETGLPAPTTNGSIGSVGRWPSNVLLTDPIFDGGWDGVVGGGEAPGAVSNGSSGGNPSMFNAGKLEQTPSYGDSGTYSRFFILPKASRSDREPILTPDWFEGTGRVSTHPTVKPTELMRHLVRLVTPAGGTVLDPFLGSGTTGLACELEGFPWIGIEKEAEYVAIAEARLNGTQRGLGLPA